MTGLSEMGFLESLALAITSVFLAVILSYYVLFFIKRKKTAPSEKFSGITVVIPAHNEEEYIRDAIESAIGAEFDGGKEIIVVDDGSADRTAEIAASYSQVKLIRTKHSGKSASINRALSEAKGDLIAIVDGDSRIQENSLKEMAAEVGRDNTAAACCPVRVRNRKKFICMWLHISEIYFSLMRGLFSKINANITTPGPLSVYRKKALLEVGGFSTQGFSEDADITIRLIRKGYRIGFSENTSAETNMPYTFKGFLRQRARFARGLINLLKRHMRFNRAAIDAYTLPIFLFTYVQSVIMGSLSIYQIVSGYITYFYSKGIYLNALVLKFFFEWFSIAGFFRWMLSIITGETPLTLIAAFGIISTLLTYPLYLFAIFKFDRKIDIWHIIPILFMFPFWLVLMAVHIISLPEALKKEQYNIWEKSK